MSLYRVKDVTTTQRANRISSAARLSRAERLDSLVVIQEDIHGA